MTEPDGARPIPTAGEPRHGGDPAAGEATVTIRAARPAEATALTELAMRSKAVWGYGAAFMERCRPLLTVTAASVVERPVFVAEADGAVAGFYALGRRGDGVELDLLFVEPARLRRGVGRRLLAHALDRARALGHTELIVESDPGAEAFYAASGATRIGAVASTVEAGRALPLLRFELGGTTSHARPA